MLEMEFRVFDGEDTGGCYVLRNISKKEGNTRGRETDRGVQVTH